MKKFLIVFVLMCLGITPMMSVADDAEDICYEYSPGAAEEQLSIIKKYFGNAVGSWKNQESYYAGHWFREQLAQNPRMTCSDLNYVCYVAWGSNYENRRECKEFIDELQSLWKKYSISENMSCMHFLSKKIIIREEMYTSIHSLIKTGWEVSSKNNIECSEEDNVCVVNKSVSNEKEKKKDWFYNACFKVNMTECGHLDEYSGWAQTKDVKHTITKTAKTLSECQKALK